MLARFMLRKRLAASATWLEFEVPHIRQDHGADLCLS